MVTYDFTGQTAIVTGGTRGIGRAVTEGLLGSGARVIATYSGNQAAADALLAANAQASDRLELRRFDVSNYEDVECFYRDLEARGRTLQILVNNAGIRRDGVVGLLAREDWQRVIDVNLTGVFNMSKFAVHNMMQTRYGRIINITSPSGKLGFEGQANYAASKAGMVAFTRSLSKEVAKRRITVNCVSPGFIETEFISGLGDDQLGVYKGMVPVKRFGTPGEVAACVLFLASSASAYVTGATLEVTGGL